MSMVELKGTEVPVNDVVRIPSGFGPMSGKCVRCVPAPVPSNPCADCALLCHDPDADINPVCWLLDCSGTSRSDRRDVIFRDAGEPLRLSVTGFCADGADREEVGRQAMARLKEIVGLTDIKVEED